MFANLFGFPQGGPGDDQVEIVHPDTVRQWVRDGEAVLVDVRESNEYASEHIPGSHHNPLSRFDPSKVKVADGKKLVVHCRSGSRCGMAAMRLVQSGYEGKIHRMQGGIMGWYSVGGELKRGF